VTEGVDLVTVVSSTRPFLGEQISVVYRLQTRVAIAALDVDPQNFDGFWSVVVPVSEVEPAGSRGTVQQFILRQVVAWPLRVGSIGLPPLRLKARLSGRKHADTAWDLIAETEPPAIVVRDVPESSAQLLPLVGNLTATVRTSPESGSVVLELAGTANLSFFEPLQWLQGAPSLRAVLLDSDQVPQRQFKEGALDLTLLQRRRWRLLSYSGRSALSDGVPEIRYFDPADGTWKTIALGGAGRNVPLNEAASNKAKAPPERSRPGLRMGSAVVVLVLVAAAVALIAGRTRRRKSAG